MPTQSEWSSPSDDSLLHFFHFFFFLYLSATRLMRSRDGHFCCVPSRGSEIKTELVFNPASVHYDTNMRIT